MNNKTIVNNLLIIVSIICFNPLFQTTVTAQERPYQAYQVDKNNTGWRVLPVRSRQEYEAGLTGGGSLQIMHGMVRSKSNPDIIYAIQDVAGVWRSCDGGQSWIKPRAQGLVAYYGQSIAVDPVSPARVIVSSYHPWDGQLKHGMNEYAGIYISEDYGETFKLVLQKPDFGFQWSLHRGCNENIAYAPSLVDENGAAVWYAAFHGKGLYQSADYGNSWELKNELSEHEIIYEIEVHPTWPDSIYLACGKGLYVSDDAGSTFSKITTLPDTIGTDVYDQYMSNGPFNPGVASIEIDPRKPWQYWLTRVLQYDTNPSENGISSRKYGIGLYKTNNAGASFEKVDYTTRTGAEAQAFKIYQSPAFPDTLILTTGVYHYYSYNNGVAWDHTILKGGRAPGLMRNKYAKIGGMNAVACFSEKDKNNVAFHAQATFFVSTDAGVNAYETNDFFTGIAWANFNSGIAFDPNNNDRFALFVCDVGFMMTENGGEYFSPSGEPVREVFSKYGVNTSYQGMTSGTFSIDAESDIIISTIGQYSKSWIVKSNDLGQSWQMYDDYLYASETHDGHELLAWHPTNEQIVYSSEYASYNGGATFEVYPSATRNATTTDKVTALDFCYHKPDVLYGIAGNRIYRSNDAGKSWELYFDVIGESDLTPIDSKPVFAVDDFDPDIIYFAGKNGDLGKFDGETVTWETGLIQLTNPQVEGNLIFGIAVDPKNEGVIYAMSAFPGTSCVFRSENRGETWEDITGVFPNCGFLSSSIVVNPHTGQLFKGGPFGTWIYTPEDNTSVRNTKINNNLISCENPLVPGKYINYHLEKPGFVELKVYDLSGLLVTSFVNNSQLPGHNKYSYSKTIIKDGVYIIVLVVDGTNMGSCKAIVIK